VMDAFRAFDSDRNGLLSPQELYGGLDWLDVKISSTDVMDLVRRIDSDGDGLITFNDFKAAFHDPNAKLTMSDMLEEPEDAQSRSGIVIAPKSVDGLPDYVAAPMTMKEEEEKKKEDFEAIDGMLGKNHRLTFHNALVRMKVSLKAPKDFEPVWDSKGSQSRNKISVWAPSLKVSMKSKLKGHKMYACIGHFVSTDYSKPTKALTLEIVDTKASIVGGAAIFTDDILNWLLPHPFKYVQVWQKKSAKGEGFAWKPIPPDGFAALGMVMTMTPEEPPVDLIRCVPLTWTKSPKSDPQYPAPGLLWDDSGTGGRPGSFWETSATPCRLLHVVAGHSEPLELVGLIKPTFIAGEVMPHETKPKS